MKKLWIAFISLFMEKQWRSHNKCVRKNTCQETEGFNGTEHEGVDVCEDGCVWGKKCWKFKNL